MKIIPNKNLYFFTSNLSSIWITELALWDNEFDPQYLIAFPRPSPHPTRSRLSWVKNKNEHSQEYNLIDFQKKKINLKQFWHIWKDGGQESSLDDRTWSWTPKPKNLLGVGGSTSNHVQWYSRNYTVPNAFLHVELPLGHIPRYHTSSNVFSGLILKILLKRCKGQRLG